MNRKSTVKLKKCLLLRSLKIVQYPLLHETSKTKFHFNLLAMSTTSIKIKNAVLRDSASGKPKFGINYDQTTALNEKEKISSEMKKQRKY